MTDHIKIFMQESGLIIGEEFVIEEYNLAPLIFKKTNIGDINLYAVNHDSECNGILIALLQGRYTVKKLPYKPRNGEPYWFVNGYGSVNRTVYTYKTRHYDRVYIGNCYRTNEEASANSKKHVAQWIGAGVDLPNKKENEPWKNLK